MKKITSKMLILALGFGIMSQNIMGMEKAPIAASNGVITINTGLLWELTKKHSSNLWSFTKSTGSIIANNKWKSLTFTFAALWLTSEKGVYNKIHKDFMNSSIKDIKNWNWNVRNWEWKKNLKINLFSNLRYAFWEFINMLESIYDKKLSNGYKLEISNLKSDGLIKTFIFPLKIKDQTVLSIGNMIKEATDEANTTTQNEQKTLNDLMTKITNGITSLKDGNETTLENIDATLKTTYVKDLTEAFSAYLTKNMNKYSTILQAVK